MAKNNFSVESRDWNDNKGFLERIDRRFDEANIAANEGYIITWYRHLKTIHRIMHHKIKGDTETKKQGNEDLKILDWLTKKFDAAKIKINELNSSYGNKMLTQQFQTFSLSKAEEILDEIDIALCDLYVKYYVRLDALFQYPNEAIREVFR